MIPDFASRRAQIKEQFNHPDWIPESGLSLSELRDAVSAIEACGTSKARIKAETFSLLLTKGRIAIDREDIFQDKLLAGRILQDQRWSWHTAVINRFLKEESLRRSAVWNELGAYIGHEDYGHTSPNSKLLLQLGLPGLLRRVEAAAEKPALTQRQQDFYASCKIVLEALMTLARRLAEAVRSSNPENSDALFRIASGCPQNSYEAMQLLILYFFAHEYVGGTRVRTLGRLDVLLQPFFQWDMETGLYSRSELVEMLKFFLHKFWTADVPYGLPFCLGGIDTEGTEVTGEASVLIVEAYRTLNIYSPKIHIRVSPKTPDSFLKQVLACIREGCSSFVFVNDEVAIRSLKQVGITEEDAREYVPIGCYEPAVWGMEIGCTGNGAINLPKAVELVFCNGRDHRTGRLCGVETGPVRSYEEFLQALKAQIRYMTEDAAAFVVKIEGYYRDINPDPLLSCQYDRSVETGVDVFEGGAKYNNSSLYFYSIASFIDSVLAVKKLVFDQGKFTFAEMGSMLKANWEGFEKERQEALRLPVKYGNNHPEADTLTAAFVEYCAGLVNNKPNGRGGVFKAALFTIDNCFRIGKLTMATPDGRFAGEPLSKNLCAVTGMDKNGVTALINSVTRFDHALFPNGSVLDIVLHPSAVQGEDGLNAFLALVKTYMRKGGFAIHGNVFNPQDLKNAQKEPEKYANLQVRVCGWNAYFVNLSKQEQDAFILQAENAE